MEPYDVAEHFGEQPESTATSETDKKSLNRDWDMTAVGKGLNKMRTARHLFETTANAELDPRNILEGCTRTL